MLQKKTSKRIFCSLLYQFPKISSILLKKFQFILKRVKQNSNYCVFFFFLFFFMCNWQQNKTFLFINRTKKIYLKKIIEKNKIKNPVILIIINHYHHQIFASVYFFSYVPCVKFYVLNINCLCLCLHRGKKRVFLLNSHDLMLLMNKTYHFHIPFPFPFNLLIYLFYSYPHIHIHT